MTSFMLSHFSYDLFPQLLSWGSMDVPMLPTEVTRAQEVAVVVEAAHAAAMLTTEASAREAVAV
jgi:hypothetical protein